MAYTMTASYRGIDYTGTGEDFNEAWEAIGLQLPTGAAGDIVDLDDDGCVGGSLRWGDGWATRGWWYSPENSDGVRA